MGTNQYYLELIFSGDSLAIDVNAVSVNNRFDRYSATTCGYGYLGDLLKDSENKRWMGPKRYDFSGEHNNSYSNHIKQDIFLAFQTDDCLLLHESSAESSYKGFLHYFHSAISNHLNSDVNVT